MLWQGPPGHRHTRGLSHFKCRQAPSIDGTIGTVGPLVPSTECATIKTTAPVNIPSDVSRHSTCKVHFISWVNFCPERHKFNKWCRSTMGLFQLYTVCLKSNQLVSNLAAFCSNLHSIWISPCDNIQVLSVNYIALRTRNTHPNTRKVKETKRLSLVTRSEELMPDCCLLCGQPESEGIAVWTIQRGHFDDG